MLSFYDSNVPVFKLFPSYSCLMCSTVSDIHSFSKLSNPQKKLIEKVCQFHNILIVKKYIYDRVRNPFTYSEFFLARLTIIDEKIFSNDKTC